MSEQVKRFHKTKLSSSPTVNKLIGASQPLFGSKIGVVWYFFEFSFLIYRPYENLLKRSFKSYTIFIDSKVFSNKKNLHLLDALFNYPTRIYFYLIFGAAL